MIHLHCHTVFSVGDGLNTSEEYARAMGGGVLAITDHDNMSGIVHHHRACEKHGVKPVYGVEITTEGGAHLTLLAKDQGGLLNLFRLGATPKSYRDLSEFSDGVIALSGDLMGAIPQAILRRDHGDLNYHLRRLQTIYRDDFYLEVIDHGLREQAAVNSVLGRLGMASVRTNDVHYLASQDALAHAVLICDRLSKRADRDELTKFVHKEAWLKPLPEDMVAREIAEKCDLRLRLGDVRLPSFDIPEGFSGGGAYLRHLAQQGLERKRPGYSQEYAARLEYELGVISQMGFDGYFLIVWDFVNFAHSRGISVGPARGSGAGSLVAYALGITDADPIQYGLLFERFLNVERISMPDFDIDFSISRREEVVRYVVQKYGEESVCQIATFSELRARSAWQSAARVSRIPHQEILREGKKIEGDSLGAEGGDYPEAMELARLIEGKFRSVGRGAAGVLISDGPLTDYIPVWDAECKDFPIKSDSGLTRFLSQVDKVESEKMGLVKFDFLGLAELDVIDYTLKLLQIQGVTPPEMSMDDPAVFDLISSGHTLGIFQLKGHGMSQIVQLVNISSFEDIVAVISLFRPGPIDAGMHHTYAHRKNGVEEVEYLHEDLEEILGSTYGVILYQEQVMQISRKIAGYSLAGADILRRAIGKKDSSEMLNQFSRFMEGGKERGYSEDVLEELWRQIETFARYGFNRSHAVGYGLIVYRTAWLKAHYPAELLAAQMQVRRDNFDEVAMYVAEAERMGIQIQNPSVSASPVNFRVVDHNKILMGLGGLKSLNVDIAHEIEEAQPFRSVTDVFTRVKVNRNTATSLIHAGAFDEFFEGDIYQSRSDLLQSLHLFSRLTRNPDQCLLFNLSEVSIPRGDDVDVVQALMLEREYGGRFITGHPVDFSDRPRGSLHLHKLPKEGAFRTCGLVKDLHEITTKRGNLMGFMTVENANTEVRFCIFPDTYNAGVHRSMVGSIVHIKGMGSTYNGEFSPILEEVKEWKSLN